MPCPNAKSRIASSKTCMKTGTFAAKPKVTNNVEDNHDILEDWELFELTHENFQTYALKAIKWHNAADRKLKSTFYTEFKNKPLEKKSTRTLQHEAKKMKLLIKCEEQKQKVKKRYQFYYIVKIFLTNLNNKLRNQLRIRNTKYMACCLRGWAKAFLDQGSLPSHR
ncbi:1344_t:CDS:2 [Gigaspora rosea]|nr:1344_t:CDS:2 [Gigaspora rosea]